jgi:dTDP-glucose 4,6-dehydratase
MNILVTGGAGFIGSNFVNRLFAEEYDIDFNQVYILDSLTYAGSKSNLNQSVLNDPRLHFIVGSINDKVLVSELVTKVDTIVNFAAESHVDRSIENPELFLVTNVLGTTNILNALVGRNDKKLVQISTDEVYGSIDDGSWDEVSEVSPNSPYSASKASADLLCKAFHKTYGVNVVVTRCSNNYGPNQFPEKLIPLTVKKLTSGESVPIYGNGLQTREWIHVDDHCLGIALVLSKGRSGEIYNIGSGIEIENMRLVEFIITYLGLDLSQISHVADRLGHDSRYSVNFEKIVNELGYATKVGFEQGMRDTIDWYKVKFSTGFSSTAK